MTEKNFEYATVFHLNVLMAGWFIIDDTGKKVMTFDGRCCYERRRESQFHSLSPKPFNPRLPSYFFLCIVVWSDRPESHLPCECTHLF